MSLTDEDLEVTNRILGKGPIGRGAVAWLIIPNQPAGCIYTSVFEPSDGIRKLATCIPLRAYEGMDDRMAHALQKRAGVE